MQVRLSALIQFSVLRGDKATERLTGSSFIITLFCFSDDVSEGLTFKITVKLYKMQTHWISFRYDGCFINAEGTILMKLLSVVPLLLSLCRRLCMEMAVAPNAESLHLHFACLTEILLWWWAEAKLQRLQLILSLLFSYSWLVYVNKCLFT